MERPDQLAGDDVVGAQIAGRRAVAFAGVRAGDEQILEHAAGRAARAAERPQRAFAHVHAPVDAERRIGAPVRASIARRNPPAPKISRRSDRSSLSQ